MNNNKKTYKTNSLSSSQPPPTKLKIITNGNGMTAVPVNGKVRGRPPKPSASTSDALDVFTFVSKFSWYLIQLLRTHLQEQTMFTKCLPLLLYWILEMQRPNGAKSSKESLASPTKGYGSYKQLSQNQKLYPASTSASTSTSTSSSSASASSSNNKSGSSSNNVNNNNNSTSNNNNSDNRSSGSIVKTASVKRNSPTNTHQPARSFQYESFHVFNWDEYLLVSIACAVFSSFRKSFKQLFLCFRKRIVRLRRSNVSNKQQSRHRMSSKLV